MSSPVETVSIELNGQRLTIEVGRMARQADGAAFVRYGESAVIGTAVSAKEPRAEVDFLPLTCDYIERTYAAGKIPGGFFKREGRPTEKETLTSRLIDRPHRPLFPKGYTYDTQIIVTAVSHDQENDPDILALVAASTALTVSDIPFAGPIGAVRVGRVDGEFIANPTNSQRERSDLEVVIAGTREAIVMVEAGAKEVPESVMIEALLFGHLALQPLIDLQEELRRRVGRPKREFTPPAPPSGLAERLKALAEGRIGEALRLTGKHERRDMLKAIRDEVLAALLPEFAEQEKETKKGFESLERELVRQRILREKVRLDGRGPADIRPITIDVGLLPRAHGSALFTRGETQALVTTTLGTKEDMQRIDALEGDFYKRFMLHYNFPPFSTGEVRFLRGPGRREIGHGALAERAIRPVLPPEEEFPYAIRIVSDILESNGSSSMATVCGASLSLMDAGVKISAPVAGIAMGLIKEGDEVVILSDILGDEDHLGDMDFKVAGTAKGITALQMDIKISGVTRAILEAALEQARVGRLYVLEKMREAIAAPRPDLSVHAPRITVIHIRPEKIKDVIGPGGKVIKGIIEQTGVKIDVEDSGKVSIASSNGRAAEQAIRMIREITQEAEVGKLYMGKVKKITDFGAFVEIFPGTDGLIHISQLAEKRVARVEDVLKEGDEVLVKVLDVDKSGRIRLSRKEALGQTLNSKAS
ncbi:MAG TPA: polyribonucleotide nucleotidyltransferase [Thermodesulfobacteriota bacterium]|nr:polyribonucleotide nucleotidyltransferase [Thermodesulfobacteriota bacterium]